MMKKISQYTFTKRLLILFLTYCLVTGSLMPAATAFAAEDIQLAVKAENTATFADQPIDKTVTQDVAETVAQPADQTAEQPIGTTDQTVAQPADQNAEPTLGQTVGQSGSELSGQAGAEAEAGAAGTAGTAGTENGNEENTDEDLALSEDETEEAIEEAIAMETEEEIAAAKDQELENARKALQEILKDKSVMALVYLCDTYAVKTEPDPSSDPVVTVSSGQTVEILDVSLTDQTVWYRVRLYYNGSTEYTGYIPKEKLAYSDELLLAWEAEYLTSLLNTAKSPGVARRSRALPTYPDIEQFPASYRSKLYELKAQYPNWIFVRSDAKDSWDTAVANEMLPPERSLIYYTADSEWKDLLYDYPWYIATKQAVAYCMDPRNYFDEKAIFQFEQLTYNASYHTEAALDSILSATFMNGRIPDDSLSYSQAFMLLGEQYGISPYHLAARVYQEQGPGNSPLISGTYPGYVGYYNYFNVGAYGIGEEVYLSGMRYASGQGWNTRFKSLSGGAATIGNNYIKKGQDTLYLQKFNVVSGVYYHQYMQNIQAPASEASKSWQLYKASGALNNPFVFKIPVYEDMPSDTGADAGDDVDNIIDDTIKDDTVKDDTVKDDTVKDDTVQDDTVKATALNVESEAYELVIGDSITVTATVLPENTDDKTLVWESDNTAVASVDATGKVTAIDVGAASITAATTDGSELRVAVTITVKDGIQYFGLDKTAIQMTAGESADLVATVQAYSGKAMVVTWSSHNPEVAGVDAAGKITAYSEGSTIITATAGDRELTCKVNILPSAVLDEEPPTFTLPKNEKISAVQVSYNLKPAVDNRYSEGFLQIKTKKGTILDPSYFTYQSGNEAAVLVDADGRVTPNPAYNSTKNMTVSVTATLKNDPSNRAVTFWVTVLAREQAGQNGANGQSSSEKNNTNGKNNTNEKSSTKGKNDTNVNNNSNEKNVTGNNGVNGNSGTAGNNVTKGKNRAAGTTAAAGLQLCRITAKSRNLQLALSLLQFMLKQPEN